MKIPLTQLYGFDLEPAFIDLGYELFCDRDKLRATMMSGDVFTAPSSPEGKNLTELKGKMDIIHAAYLLHSWGWDDMVIAAKRLVTLTRKEPGSLVVDDLGSLDPGKYPMLTRKVYNYRHEEESMERFWKQIV